MFVVGNGVPAWAEPVVPSGLAAIMFAAPIWLAVWGWLLLQEAVPRLSMLGLLAGFIGIAVLVGPVTLASQDFCRASRL